MSRDLATALRWLEIVRLLLLVVEAVYATWLLQLDPKQPEISLMFGLMAFALVMDLAERAVVGRAPVSTAVVVLHAATDIFLAAAFSLVLGGPANPANAAVLVEVAIVSLWLPARPATAIAAIAVTAAFAGTALKLLVGHAAGPDPTLGVAPAFGLVLAVIGTTGVLQRMATVLAQVEQERRSADQERAHLSRLAALGTLAAGTAHELATPLGTILLVIDEMEASARPDDAEREMLGLARVEIGRCRDILDRMRTGSRGGAGQTSNVGRHVNEWVTAWKVAHPGAPVATEIPAALDEMTVRGEPEGWRRAVWTVLDNALRAGAPERVRIERGPGDALLLIIDNRGIRLDDALAQRIGEPFFTAWPDGGGTGLGIYASRVFARAAGGDLRVFPRSQGGARVTITLRAAG